MIDTSDKTHGEKTTESRWDGRQSWIPRDHRNDKTRSLTRAFWEGLNGHLQSFLAAITLADVPASQFDVGLTAIPKRITFNACSCSTGSAESAMTPIATVRSIGRN